MRFHESLSPFLGALLSASTFVHALPNRPDPRLPIPPNSDNITQLSGYEELFESPHLVQRAKVDLRIMVNGASIAFGYGSANGNGFKKNLRDQARFMGHEVNMVGTKSCGAMKDNNCEAVSGAVITQAHDFSKLSYKFKPNVVVINIGTNDCSLSTDIPNAANRVKSLIDDLWTNIGSDTCVILTTILDNPDPTATANRAIVNTGLRQLVTTYRSAGKRIVLADIDPPNSQASGWLSHATDYFDNIHPNEVGFKKMASIIWNAISQALTEGKISAPQYSAEIGVAVTTDTTCKKPYGDGISVGAKTQVGSGADDGFYIHGSTSMGNILSITSDYDRDQFFFARLFQSDRDDLLEWYTRADGAVAYGVWRNDGNGKFTKIVDLTPGGTCIPRGVVFIDLDGDGLDDLVCIAADGNVYASHNNGNGTPASGLGPTFTSLGLIKAVDANYPQAQIRLADIDGDGRADFIGLSPNGDAYAWRSGGTGNAAEYWESLGLVFTGKNMGDLAGTRFEDINGDGRDDWMWVADGGATTTYTNGRSCIKRPGGGLNFAFHQGFLSGQTSGPTHIGGFGTTATRDRIHFARIYGISNTFGVGAPQDYIYMQHVVDGTKHKFSMNVWKNVGAGHTKAKADGDKYGDMTGDGRDDYVWTQSTGLMTIYQNGGQNFISAGQNYWSSITTMFTPSVHGAGNLDRRDLHLAHYDTDKKMDIFWTDPANSNRLRIWINKSTAGGFDWAETTAPAAVNCAQKRGLGVKDLAVQMADLTGNGLADYICLEKDGRASGYVHETDGSWSYQSQIALSKGRDRANLRFADVNGDGRADMIWVDKFSGDASVYYNNGRMAAAGSSFAWSNPPDLAYAGSVAGQCQHFPDFNGDKRADLHSVFGTETNDANSWYNTCGPIAGDVTGDDEAISDPGLPLVPGYLPGGIFVPVPGEGDWTKDTCTNPAITSAGIDSSIRWSEVHTEAAWTDAISHWTGRTTNALGFSRDVSDFFHLAEQMDCNVTVANNGCTEYRLCQDSYAPAGYMVINSFVSLNNIIWNFYTGIGNAQTTIGNQLGAIADTFNKVPKEDLSLKIMLDILGLAFALFAAPMWNAVLKKISYLGANPNTLSTVKDTINPLVSSGITIAKDSAKVSSFDMTKELGFNLGEIVTKWYSSISAYQSHLFDGSGDSIPVLHAAITNGGVLGNAYTPLPDIDIQGLVSKSIHSVIIPMIWQSLSQEKQWPFVLKTGIPCSSTAWTTEQFRIDEKDRANTEVCFDSSVYYLVGATATAQTCKAGYCNPASNVCNPDVCTDNQLSALKGAEAINGKNYGGLTKADLVAGALSTYKANGNKNDVDGNPPTEVLDPLNPDLVDGLYEFSLKTPGIVRFPVCTFTEALAGWEKGSRKGNFPCA